jgi:hypothetical protein
MRVTEKLDWKGLNMVACFVGSCQFNTSEEVEVRQLQTAADTQIPEVDCTCSSA